MTVILIIIVLLEALVIFLLVANDRYRTMCQDILAAIKKAIKKQKKEGAQ